MRDRHVPAEAVDERLVAALDLDDVAAHLLPRHHVLIDTDIVRAGIGLAGRDVIIAIAGRLDVETWRLVLITRHVAIADIVVVGEEQWLCMSFGWAEV